VIVIGDYPRRYEALFVYIHLVLMRGYHGVLFVITLGIIIPVFVVPQCYEDYYSPRLLRGVIFSSL